METSKNYLTITPKLQMQFYAMTTRKYVVHLLCEIEKVIRQEVRELCKRSYTSTFHASKPSEVKSFTCEEQEKEHVEQCPILYRIVTAAAIKKKNLKRNDRKSSDTIKRAILTGI